MSRETEKIMRQLTKYLETNMSGSDSEADLNALTQRFMEEYNATLENNPFGSSEPKTAEDYLELAEDASTRKEKRNYVQKALELDPEHLDALRMRAELSAKTPHDLLESLPPIIEAATQRMRQDGSYDDMKGHFWNIIETRPYMRLRYQYMDTLVKFGMIRKAAAEGEQLLELCEDDNLGVRYVLMHLYVLLEDADAALALNKKYGGDRENDTQLLLPLAVLYYKLNRLDTSLEYLKRLNSTNKDTKKFLGAVANDTWEKYLDEMSPYGYSPFCMDELVYAYSTFEYLYETVPYFSGWAYGALTEKQGKARHKK